MGLLDRMRKWLGPATADTGEHLSEAARVGGAAVAAGPGGHHRDAVTPVDDLGAQGGAPDHDDPLKPKMR